ncbi:CueP family metal-binding protein [Ornithinimicrobium cavernae]|uniref:CueP family metal-binding protein n=1 Tax=Ornithinimicrobium cavernae TaxID=2666047 RepID=UPI000D69AD05|nr:CueP family metal-binding protein [Ornithinimicrobium cavernae]
MRLPAALGLTVLVLAVAGCSSDPAGDAVGGAGDSVATADAALLAAHGLEGLSATQIVDTLDSSTDARPLPFGASVTPTQVTLTDGEQEVALALPEDSFYLSVAPFVTSTHECYFHSLAGCQGELVDTQVDVRITGTDGATLVDERVTTGTNGFAGFWLPRDITGTIRIEHEGRTGAAEFATDADSPTCLTTLQLSA